MTSDHNVNVNGIGEEAHLSARKHVNIRSVK